MLVAYYFVQGLRAWFLFINSVVFAFILPLSWLRFFWWRLNIYGESAALIVGLPLSYIVWFPLGFSNEQDHAFWEGFLLLFGLGAVTSIIVSLVTRPEPIETLREFHGRCRPPGLWGPVVHGLSKEAARCHSPRDGGRSPRLCPGGDVCRCQHRGCRESPWPALDGIRCQQRVADCQRRAVHAALGTAGRFPGTAGPAPGSVRGDI